ncbi:MAG: Nre family DNA repair protein [Sulfolobales archaeon]|nr:Nre family DNA repair protein [Sulfolobales archaeon]MCX8185884.1 Nre family DNA repair protein [Sulfolobales archaeon]MDW7969141.1 Nre family DNA repair protein [Sulfolobales archaeon]
MQINGSACVKCRGGKNLCGLSYCPLMLRMIINDSRIRSNNIYGSSPPSLFVGRYGYPYVSLGPAAPPEIGDTSIYDSPEEWVNLSLNEILGFRYSLIRGTYVTLVNDVNNKYVKSLQELALTVNSVDTEMVFEKVPKPRIFFDEHLPPQGPSAPLKNFKIVSNPLSDRRLEKVFYDTDLKASEGITNLYQNNVPVSAIQRLLSVGGVGTVRFRKLVPTRWSITAVDSMVSNHLVSQVRKLPIINSYMLYVRKFMNNLFIGMLIPKVWSFEWMEAWFPGSTWNKFGITAEIEGDYEGYKGRTKYPGIGGCYYASRLASTEHLLNLRKQATVILWREIYEGFDIPVGVWFVRENIRALLKDRPKVFTCVNDLINYLKELKPTRVPIEVWIRKSNLMREALTQERLDKFLR